MVANVAGSQSNHSEDFRYESSVWLEYRELSANQYFQTIGSRWLQNSISYQELTFKLNDLRVQHELIASVRSSFMCCFLVKINLIFNFDKVVSGNAEKKSKGDLGI